jgi:hypothetical protein
MNTALPEDICVGIAEAYRKPAAIFKERNSTEVSFRSGCPILLAPFARAWDFDSPFEWNAA